MSTLHKRPKGFVAVPFGLSILAFGMAPTPLGYQDLGALIARQPAVAERGRQHIIGMPFTPVQASLFSFPRPVGTAMPDATYRLASLTMAAPEATGATASDPVSPK